MIYIDTSLVVAALTHEQATVSVQTWLDQQKIDEIFISDWTITEVSSALSMKIRTNELSSAGRKAASAKFDDLRSTGFRRLPVTAEHFLTAARFAASESLGLRASDALHLAIAAEHQATVFTLDHRLINAGPKLGILTRSPLG